MLPKLIAIVGPTASGKTRLGIEIAKLVDGEIISIDSRQVYKEMDIGTAKEKLERVEVGKDERGESDEVMKLWSDGVMQWGIDLVDPDEDYNVADFRNYAEQKISEILERKHVPILVGGTGFWLSVIIDNYDLTQTAGNSSLRAGLESRSIDDLFAEYKKLDPKGAELIDKSNKRRLVRALEVTKLSGKQFSEQQTKGEPKYDVLQIGLKADRAELYRHIDARVDEMIAKGLVDEVRGLKEKYGCEIESMTGIGYRQICKYLEGKMTLEKAIEEIKKTTRHYAKRQMTWFRRDPRINWVSDSADSFEHILRLVKDDER